MYEFETPNEKQYHPIIEISNGFKHYGLQNHWHLVLSHFDMAIYSGETYVLLGPLGCGKSTVLHVILGLTRLTKGHVQIFGFEPGHELIGVRVGYAPQSLGLYSSFTSNEILYYYGTLLGMRKSYVMDRVAYLTESLSLPRDKSSSVAYCTADVQRKISFAIALLHEPQVVILDEPTTGIDPVLRETFWRHLKDLSSEKEITILMSTTDCMEASRADKLGIIKNGHLIFEGSPSKLLDKLENFYKDVYLLSNMPYVAQNARIETKSSKISPVASEGFISADENQLPPVVVINNESSSVISTKKRFFRSINCSGCIGINLIHSSSNRRVRALILKNFTRIFRSYTWMAIFLLIPVLFIFMYGYTIGTAPRSVRLGIVNYEVGNKSCNDRPMVYASCIILNMIDDSVVVQVPFASFEDAWKAAKNLYTRGVFLIKTNVTNKLDYKTLLRSDSNKQVAAFVLHLDYTNKIVAGNILETVKEAVHNYIHMTNLYKTNDVLVDDPLEVGESIYGNHHGNEREYLAPGLVVILVYHISALITAYNIVNDKVMNLYQRDYLAGVTLAEVAISHTITNTCHVFVQVVLVFIAMILVLKVPLRGNLFYLVPVILLQIWCGIFFGIFLSTIFKTTINTVCCIILCLVGTLLLCGALWPLEGLPSWLQIAVKILPQTYSAFTVRSIMLRGMSLRLFGLWLGLIVPLCWLLIFCVFFSITHRYL